MYTKYIIYQAILLTIKCKVIQNLPEQSCYSMYSISLAEA